jgi:hypothetical protein
MSSVVTVGGIALLMVAIEIGFLQATASLGIEL